MQYPSVFSSSIFVHPLIPSSIHSFIHSFIHPLIHSSTHSFIHSFIHPLIHSSIHSFIHSFLHPFIHSSIHSFIHSFIHPFIPSSIHSFIHSFIHPFIPSSIHFLINPFLNPFIVTFSLAGDRPKRIRTTSKHGSRKSSKGTITTGRKGRQMGHGTRNLPLLTEVPKTDKIKPTLGHQSSL